MRKQDATVTALHAAELDIEGERMPVFAHLIDHPAGRVLVDTGMTEFHLAHEGMVTAIFPLSDRGLTHKNIHMVVNTHLHADHCGGNRQFPGVPIYVQRAELDDARAGVEPTILEWVDAPGLEYVELDGETEILPGIRLLPAPGHTRGSQIVVVDTEEGPVVIAGDTAVWSGQLEEPETEGQQLILSLHPHEVWLAHEDGPWRPEAS
jgi:N-acyl homoserine lactone hydrolase